jgi:UrcA family protein
MLTSKLASVTGLIAAAVLAAGATSALAASPDGQVSVRLSLDDLNMNSEAGAQEALARIGRAARAICGDSDTRVSLGRQMQLRSCVTSTVERAVAGSNLPTLIAASHGRLAATMASAAR